MTCKTGEETIRELMTRCGLSRDAAEFLVYVMHDGTAERCLPADAHGTDNGTERTNGY